MLHCRRHTEQDSRCNLSLAGRISDSMLVPRIRSRASTASIRPLLLWAVIFGIVLPGFPPLTSVFAATIQEAAKETTNKTGDPTADGYVGSAACARCHRDIFLSFTRTRMGRSLVRVTPGLIQTLSLPGFFYSGALDRRFEVFSRNGKLYQSEAQIGAGGQEIFRETQEIDWVIGAGANGFGALVKRGDYLFEAPLTFYAKTQKWELSPGYERVDYGFNRPIQAECIFCHSGRPKPVETFTGKFDATPFSQLAIGCENCHGPGESHIRARSVRGSSLKSAQIVNPDRLSADLENNICMSCHEGGDSRIPRPGKSYRDFRPGEPLDETLSILMVPLNREKPRDSDHVNHYFEMSMSQCYRATAGQMRCTTCHDPHVEPSPAEAPAFFNAKCMGCHASRPCTLPAATRQSATPADNCIGCHMPRRDVPENAQTSLTNHRIRARPGEPWPDSAFGQSIADPPGLVHLNRVPGHADPLPPESLLLAYSEIGERLPEYASLYLKTLGALQQANPDSGPVQLALGYQALRDGQLPKALEHLRRAIELDPQVALSYAYLSEALKQNNEIDAAITAIEKAVRLEPYNPELQKALIDRLLAARQPKKAETALQHYLEVFPQDGSMRELLQRVRQ